MTAPQIIAIILLTAKVIIGLCIHGRQITVNFVSDLVGAALWGTVLYCGGFFD